MPMVSSGLDRQSRTSLNIAAGASIFNAVDVDMGHYQVLNDATNFKEAQAVISSAKKITSLWLNGCCYCGDLRLCHTCHDTFAIVYNHASYANLASLSIVNSLVSGNRLRRFIKLHATSLTSIHFSSTTLTDGTWYSIAQGVKRLPNIKALAMSDFLLQKHAHPLPYLVSLPSGFEICTNE
jgi:hypothetical protein